MLRAPSAAAMLQRRVDGRGDLRTEERVHPGHFF